MFQNEKLIQHFYSKTTIFFPRTKAKAKTLRLKAEAKTYMFVFENAQGQGILQGLHDC